MTSPDLELLLDRLLSASTPSDCLNSLDELQKSVSSSNADASNTADAIVENHSILKALCHLIGTSTLPPIGEGDGMKVEGGEIGAAELLLEILPPPPADSKATTTQELTDQRTKQRRIESRCKSLLHFHQHPIDGTLPDLALIPSLLDCLCSDTSTYARVLSLQILSSLLKSSPGSLREQLLQAPDGINRLVDLMGHSPDNPGDETPEEVRNASILFLADLASSSSMLARLITFSEGYTRSLKIAASSDYAISIDCLGLCVSLASQDEVARELFLGGGDGRGNLERIAMLLDLRRGERFRSEERNLWWRDELRRRRDGGVKKVDEKKGEEKKKTKRGKQRKDDLDDILSGADVSTTADASQSSINNAPAGPPVPYLIPDETTIFELICDLLLVLLYDGESPETSRISEQSATKRRARAKEIVSHDLLTRSIVDCALYTLPPPGVDFVSAVPPPGLQRKALMLMAVMGSMGDTLSTDGMVEADNGGSLENKRVEEDTRLQSHLLFEVMPLYLQGKVTAMERLMYLACTGAYRPQNEEDECPEAAASLISLNAIAVFRSCLPAETACRMVLHALAPPPPEEEEAVAPLEMPVVTKLVTTLVENLRFLQSNQHHIPADGDENPDFDITAIYSATIGASGAADALGILLTKGEGDATREMLLRMVPPSPPPLEPDEVGAGMPEPIASANLIDFVLQFISSYDHSQGSLKHDKSVSNAFQKSVAYVTLSLLKFLAEWIEGMPKAVSEVLSSPSSVSLGVLVRSKGYTAVPAMSGLLLGLCLDYIADKGSSDSLSNAENSAWTKETILNMIQSMGVGKYFGMLDEWKKKASPLPYCSGDEAPVLERRVASAWYGHSVTQVRRRIVATLAGDAGENELDSDTEGDDATESNASIRSLRKMIKNQAKEMEELQSRLDESLQTIETQSSQIKSLKRVAELGTSAETNDMLTEYSDKVTELEKEKAEVINEAERKANLQEEKLAAKEQEIASLQEELRQARLAVEESERDKETLSEEMAGLSAAYNSLEQEYRSGSFNSASEAREMTAGGETAIEGGGITSAPGGEVAAENPGRTNHQLHALQEENARLREDVRAANEWMAMAVSKMDEMGRENETLSASLKDAQNQTTNLPSYLKEKDDELTQQKVTIQELEGRNDEAQQWIDSAVARLDSLTTEVQELKSRNAELEPLSNESTALHTELEEAKVKNVTLTAECQTLQGNLAEFQSWSETAQNRLAEMEQALQEVTIERDELKNTPQPSSEDASAQVELLQAELDKKTEELERMQSQLIEDSDANEAIIENLRKDFQQHKDVIEALTAERDELLAQASSKETDSSITQDRMSELEGALTKVTEERDELMKSVLSSSNTTDEHIVSLRSELKLKTEELEDARSQLEQVQTQLIEESDTSETLIENLKTELEAQKHRFEALVSEKEELVANFSTKQIESDSQNTSLQAQVEVLNKNIADLEAAKKIAEEHAEDLMKLATPANTNHEDEIIALTADRNEIKSHFDDLSEEYDQTRQALERVQVSGSITCCYELHCEILTKPFIPLCYQMENGNLLARNRALEQDNKSLEYQFTEASSQLAELSSLQSRIDELEESINFSQEEKSALQTALDDMQISSEEAVQLWKERAEELESNLSLLESQLKDQEDEAIAAIAQWEERAQSLEANMTSLENQVDSLSGQNDALQNTLTENSERMQTEILEKDEAIASYDEQIDLLTKELVTTREESEQVVKQWQDRSEELEANINELNESLGSQQVEATEVIAQWETRCAVLSDRIEELENQLTSQDPVAETLQANLMLATESLEEKKRDVARLMAEVDSIKLTELQKENQISSLLSELEDTRSKLDRSTAEHELLRQTLSHKENEHADRIKHITTENNEAFNALKNETDNLNTTLEEMQKNLAKANDELTLKEKEWTEKEVALHKRIDEAKNNQISSSQSSLTLQAESNMWKQKVHDLEHENSLLEKKKEEALQEAEESSTLMYGKLLSRVTIK